MRRHSIIYIITWGRKHNQKVYSCIHTFSTVVLLQVLWSWNLSWDAFAKKQSILGSLLWLLSNVWTIIETAITACPFDRSPRGNLCRQHLSFAVYHRQKKKKKRNPISVHYPAPEKYQLSLLLRHQVVEGHTTGSLVSRDFKST